MFTAAHGKTVAATHLVVDLLVVLLQMKVGGVVCFDQVFRLGKRSTVLQLSGT